MTVELLDHTAALLALRPEWEALWTATADATPFQHPAWLLPWWAAFGTPEPRVAAYRRHGRLAGILPCYVLRRTDGATLLPIGAGTSDYLDVLGEGEAPMLAALLRQARADGVRRCDWPELPPGSVLRDVAVPEGWTASLHDQERCPVLTLPGLPRGIARKLRMSRHRAEREGGWAVQPAGPEGLDVLVGLHQARWTGAGETGVLADPAVLACLRGALPALQQAGLLRVGVLRVGGDVAAAILALLSPGRLYFYLSGYDTGRSFVSPGTLLVGAMLEEAMAEGRAEAHFLRGREPYKYAWGAVDRINATRSFHQ